MGCRLSRLLYLLTGRATPAALSNPCGSADETRPKYSWETREKLDPKDYTIENLHEGAAGRLPGTIAGQQFIVQNCQNSTIVLLDHIGSITVDDCVACKIIVGPVTSSIFFRGCKDCVCIVACGQFRMRDCRSVTISLFCATQPIIESSSGIRLACFQFFYPALKSQFDAAHLSVFDNNWWHVHDFTPSDAGSNWETVKLQESPIAQIVESWAQLGDDLNGVEISMDKERSVVPYTSGDHGPHDGDVGFVCFFGVHLRERALEYLRTMSKNQMEVDLVKTKEVELSALDAERIFGTSKLPGFSFSKEKTPVVGMQFSGIGVCDVLWKASEMLKTHGEPNKDFVYVAEESSTAAKRAESFFCFADMTMGA